MPFIALCGVFIATIGVFLHIFNAADESVRPEVKRDISRWLQGIPYRRRMRNWPNHFAAVFDSFFGIRHISWRCFSRSCVISLISVAILVLFWWALRPEQFTGSTKSFFHFSFNVPGHTFGVPWMTIAAFIMLPIANLVPDYFSLLETRWLIRFLRRNWSAHRVIFFIVMDVLLTSAISCFAISIFYYSIFLVMHISEDGFSVGKVNFFKFLLASVRLTPTVFKESIYFSPGAGVGATSIPWGIFFYSAFFTSLWLWLYVLSGLLVKVAEKFAVGVRFFNRVANIDEKPIRAMGLVVCLLLLFGFIISSIVIFLL